MKSDMVQTVVEKISLGGEDLISMEDTNFWMNAIINEDAVVIQNELSGANPKRRETLLNGLFDCCGDLQNLGIKTKDCEQFSRCRLNRPWCLAGAYGSTKVLELFVQHGVNVLQRDTHNVNILHAMANMAFLVPAREETLVKTYELLKSLLDAKALHQLLMDENADGVRPVELASHVGCFGLFQAIFETEGVYLTRQETHSFYDVQWFDVTDYESTKPGNRRLLSPLLLAMFVDSRAVSRSSCQNFFSSDLLHSWVRMKARSNVINLSLWVLSRMVLMLLIISFDMIGGWNDMLKLTRLNELIRNGSLNDSFFSDYSCFVKHAYVSSGAAYASVGFGILAYSVFIVIFDCIEAMKFVRLNQSWRMKTPNGRKSFLVNILFYRCVHLSMAINLVMAFIIRFYELSSGRGPPRGVTDIMYAIVVNCSLWSFLYFVQPMPWIGSFIIAIQRMVSDIFKFTLVFLAFLLPFSLCFSRLIYQNVKGECPPEFEVTSETMYTIFTTLFNMVNFSQMNLENTTGVYIFHVIFVFVTAILLLNFLIANFANSAGFVSENREILYIVQKMSVIWPCEDRIASISPGLIHRQHAQSFVYDKYTDRFYITRVQLKEKIVS